MIYVLLTIILCYLIIMFDKKKKCSVFSRLPTYKYMLYFPYLVFILFLCVINVGIDFINIYLEKIIKVLLKLIGLKTY